MHLNTQLMGGCRVLFCAGFEDTPEKRQLAILSAIIKGISWHCDSLIVNNKAVVKFDAHGAL